MYTIFDKYPAPLWLFEKVQVVCLLFEADVCLNDETHHDVEKADIVYEEEDNKE